MPQENTTLQEILLANQAAAAAEKLPTQNEEIDKTHEFFSSAIHEVLDNQPPANAGEWLEKIGVTSQENFTKVVEQLYNHPVVPEAIALYEQIFKGREYLTFHGGVHGFDIACKGLVIAMQEGIIPTDRVTSLTVGIFLGLLFHDSGITMLDAYSGHEAGSISIISTLLFKLEMAGKVPEADKTLIWVGVISIYGTKIIGVGNNLESMSIQDDETFKYEMIADLQRVRTEIKKKEPRTVFSAAVLAYKINELFEESDFYELVRKLSLVYCTADTIGLVAENSTDGTQLVAREVDSLNARNPLAGLEPRVFIGRIAGLIGVCRSAAGKLSRFPQELLSDKALAPWYRRAARLREFTDQQHITTENATTEFIKAWPKMREELAQSEQLAVEAPA